MNEIDHDTINEMNTPVFSNYDETRPFVIVSRDLDEGSRAMWREYARFSTKEECRELLRRKREARAQYEDETGYESLIQYKIVEDK